MSQDQFIALLKQRLEDIEAELKPLYKEVAEIQTRIQENETVREHLRALLRAEGAEARNQIRTVAVRSGQDADWRGMTVPQATMRLLREAGRPMHADEIRRELEERGMTFSEKDPKATVVTALLRGERAGRFVRTAPNTFAVRPSTR